MTVPLHLFIHPLIVLFFRGAQSGKATHVSDAANAKSAHPKHELSLPPLTRPKSSPLIKDLYCFLFMNISRLLTRTKSKTKFIFDLCTPNTLFLCFCETFLTDEISDSELMIPDFTITRCDRRQRMGGGICMYVKNSVNFTTCVSYSNSTCELLIVRLHDPSLIIVLIYRPPSCSTENFDDIINQVYQFIYSLATPLPNIIMLGDFNLPDVNWAAPNINCHNVDKLTDLADHLFINQQVEHPTRKSNILDLIFSPDEFIRSIHITETFISDHSILLAETNIPISLSNSTVFNPPES